MEMDIGMDTRMEMGSLGTAFLILTEVDTEPGARSSCLKHG